MFWLGITWGYTIAIIFTAFVAKFGSCAFAAKFFAGFSWRESGAIGSLMSGKGFINIFSFLSFTLMVFIGLWSLSFSTLGFLLVLYLKYIVFFLSDANVLSLTVLLLSVFSPCLSSKLLS